MRRALATSSVGAAACLLLAACGGGSSSGSSAETIAACMKASADGSKVVTTPYPKVKYGIPPHTTIAYFVSDKSSDDGVVQMYIFDNEEDRDAGKKALEKEAYADQKLETFGDEMVGVVFQAKEPDPYMEGLAKCAAE